MTEVCNALSPSEQNTLEMLELFWPESYDFLVRLTAHVSDYQRPQETVKRMHGAVSAALVVYHGTFGWSDRARWRAFADVMFANLAPHIERRKFLAACNPVQRDIVENEDMSLYYEDDDEQGTQSRPSPPADGSGITAGS